MNVSSVSNSCFDETSTPLVSVITPAYNCARTIERCIVSVQRQSVELEHIIVDDCSTDQTLEIATHFSLIYPGLRVYNSMYNSGPSYARNLGISYARARYIAFLDADDAWLEDKLSKQISFMQLHGYGFTYTDYRFVSANGQLIGKLVKGPRSVNWLTHHLGRHIGCLTVVLDRNFFQEPLFASLPSVIRAEDFLAWAHVLAQNKRAYRCPYDLARYTLSPSSRSSALLHNLRCVYFIYIKAERINIFFAFPMIFLSSIHSIFKRIKAMPCIPIATVTNSGPSIGPA